MREYNVALKRGVDYDEFWNDMESDTDGGKLYIPNRAVQYTNERPASLRQCWYLLTDEEAELLKQDERVYCVEIPPEQRDDIVMVPMVTQTGDFTKTTSDSGAYLNWGLIRSSNSTNVYGTGTTTALGYTYTLDGNGVDVVIQDSGIQVDHPEFQDSLGNNRVQQIDWAQASYLTGSFSQNVNHYRDYDGHGTHVAGIACGKTYGWAKEARIYSVKLSGLEGSGDSGTGISTTYAFDCIKNWHKAKMGSRPTVVNMSWGYLDLYDSVTSVNYRGTSYTDSNTTTNATYRQTNYGIRNVSGASYGWNYMCNVRIGSVDTDIQELLDAGVVVCVAAGNRSFKIDIISGTDYNNYVATDQGNKYYHRGSSPHDDDAISVGNVDSTVFSAALDQKAQSSETGPGVDVWAPGTNIMSATSNTNRWGGGSQNYYLNSSYKQTNISGTSMASPQVAGVCALILQLNPSYTPAQVKTALLTQATATIYSTGLNNDWTNLRSLQGSTQAFLYSNFSLTTTTTTSTTTTTTTSTSTTTTSTTTAGPTTTTTTSTTTTSTTTTTTSTTTTTTQAPVYCTEFTVSTSKGGYIFWRDCQSDTPAGTLLNSNKKKTIQSRTYPEAEKGMKITVKVGNSYKIEGVQIEPKP